MVHQEHTKYKLIEKVNPRKLGCSLATAMIVGAILSHDFGARNSRGSRITDLYVSPDGFLVAATNLCEYEFIATAWDFYLTLKGVLDSADLTPPEREQFCRAIRAENVGLHVLMLSALRTTRRRNV